MIILIPALVFAFGIVDAGIQNGSVLAIPSGVILSGVGDNGLYAPLIKSAHKVTSLRHFEKFQDELLCSKVGEDSYVFVRKSFPPYKRLRFRQFVLGLLINTGVGKPFQYQQLDTAEFHEIAQSIWRQAPQIVPSPSTKIRFQILLQSSTVVAGGPISINFAPGIKMKDQDVQEMIASPAELLKKPEDINSRVKELKELSQSWQSHLMLDTPFPQQVSLVKTALDNFQIFIDQASVALDSDVEKILIDPIWNSTKLRRSAKTIQELKEKAPNEYKIMMNVRKGELAQYGRVPSEEELQQLERATLSHQFSVSIIGFANGKTFQVQLPI